MKDKLTLIIRDSLAQNIGKSCNLAENIAADILNSDLVLVPKDKVVEFKEEINCLINGQKPESTYKIGDTVWAITKKVPNCRSCIHRDAYCDENCYWGDIANKPVVRKAEVETFKTFEDGEYFVLKFKYVEDMCGDITPYEDIVPARYVFKTKEKADKYLKAYIVDKALKDAIRKVTGDKNGK